MIDARLERAGWSENSPPSGWLPRVDVAELWAYRELALFLALRDLKVRYKQTLFGVAWVVIQPLAAAAIFTVFFGRLAGLPSEGVPYAVFVFAGLTLWMYFSRSLDGVAQSLVENRDLVTKIYFPRLLAPLGAALPGVVDLGVSLAVVAIFMAVYGVAPTLALVLLPAWILATIVVVLGAGLALCALNVQYRDVRYTLAFLVQLWFFGSPVVYASSLVDGAWSYLYALNPLVGILDGFRWSLVAGPAPGSELLVSLGSAALLFGAGLFYFLRAERRFADVI